MAGFGLAPFGAFGWGLRPVADTAPAPLPPTATGARLVDPVTGDYRRDAAGAFVGVSPLLQRVLWHLRTAFGSSSEAPSRGFQLPQTLGADFDAEAIARTREALAPLGGDILILSITVDRSTAPPVVLVRFQNPATGAVNTASVSTG